MLLSVRSAKPLRLGKLTGVLVVNGVTVYLHWSVLVVSAIILANAARNPVSTLVALIAYLSVLTIHECDHLYLAQRRGSQVFSIELYPIFGITRFEVPWSRFDHCVIAWGGVMAQAIFAIPVLTVLARSGYTHIDPVDAALAILGPFSVAVAMFNLLPLAPLDGATAWQIIPLAFKRWRDRRFRTDPKYKSPR